MVSRWKSSYRSRNRGRAMTEDNVYEIVHHRLTHQISILKSRIEELQEELEYLRREMYSG